MFEESPSQQASGAITRKVLRLQREIDRLLASQAEVLAEWDASREWADDDSKTAAARLARETGLSLDTTQHLLRRARRLRTMPLTAAAFESGELCSDRVDLLVRCNRPKVAELFARDEAELIAGIRDTKFCNAVQVAKYWSQHADPDGTEKQGQKLLNDRELYAARTFAGAVDVKGVHDPIGGEIWLNELKRLERILFEADWALAKAEWGEAVTVDKLRRTSAQRRADAQVEMAKRSAGADGGSNRPLVNIMLGDESFGRTCELADGTVIAPGQIVPLLGEADIRRMIFHGASRRVEVGRKRRFTGAMREAVLYRDKTCFHPSCEEPALNCEADHIDPWSNGGMSGEDNGQAGCAWHNRRKGADPPPVL